METIPISKFKATCLALLERVRRGGEPILVTRRGVPVAQVLPPPPPEQVGRSAFGCAREKLKVVGDIVSPLPEELWDALD